jgi:predicted tellurium resistance membrane protein TerC
MAVHVGAFMVLLLLLIGVVMGIKNNVEASGITDDDTNTGGSDITVDGMSTHSLVLYLCQFLAIMLLICACVCNR